MLNPADCIEPGCCRSRGKSSRRCNFHRNLREKEKDLQRWAYRKLRGNCARRRRKAPEWKKSHYDFNITLEEFREFCVDSEVLLGRGRTSQSFHIDRIEEEKGYTKGNLQRLTNAENLKKEHTRRKRIIFDYELVYRRRRGQYSNEEEAKEDEGVSEFRFVSASNDPEEDLYNF